jgi:hypothetical protein
VAEYFTEIFRFPPPFRELMCRFRNIKVAAAVAAPGGARREENRWKRWLT